MKKFAIGRYYFDSLFRDLANKSFIEDLQNEPFVEDGNFSYALGDFNVEKEKGFTFIRGTFGRVRRGELVNVYDKSKIEFKKEKLKDIVDVTIEFIIHHETHLIFVEYNSVIKPEYFASKLKKIYSKIPTHTELKLDYIFEEKDVYETIQKWQRIEHIEFKKLRPSNPSSLDFFEDVEKLLKDTGSEDTKIQFTAPKMLEKNPDEKGLNYESILIKQSLALSAHGYGEAFIQGVQDEKEVEVQSKKFIRKVEIDFSADGAINKIIQTVEEIQKGE